jgi:site-specific DNA-methyltransferase (adenine-specific)
VDPYYADESVQLFMGDCREVIPALGRTFDCIIADPPYAETSLAWDRWPDGWPTIAATASNSMWCFGSMRMLLDRRDEFAAWKLSQDVIWEKHNGSGFSTDRFKRVHETAAHWYRGQWAAVHRSVPMVAAGPKRGGEKSRIQQPGHTGRIGPGDQRGGHERLMRSVIAVRSMNGRAVHPTEKPLGILDPLIRYACPPGGTVLDPFAGSGSTAAATRMSGRKAVLIEADERYCSAIVRRLQQDVLPLETA